ncbi:MAG: type II toxin-antitoxin system RelE/ParE family toxin [Methylococcaceae bacterium]|nr:type II toxin-antitoxin system RelE/ParE family toxin [Methylococcaceae bacterium]
MTGNFRLTLRALDDIKAIGRYTLRQWGVRQRNQYLRDLDSRFKWLADRPQLGKHRPDIEQGYYCYLQGSHLIFYVFNDLGGIDIIGIPHKAMDVLNYFE